MATKVVILEPHIRDQEYPQPYNCEVSNQDIIEFKAVNSDFRIVIPNGNSFLKLVGGGDAGDPIDKTITSGTSEQFKVDYASGNYVREYTVYCNQPGQYADRDGALPTIKIVS